MRRKLWAIGVLTVILGFVEMGVAGMVSLLGVSIASPQAVLHLEPVKRAFAYFPALGTALQDQAVLLAAVLICVLVGVTGKNVLLGIITYLQAYYAQSAATFFGAGLFRSFVRKPYIWHTQQNAAELMLYFDYRTHIGLFLTNFLTFVTQSIIACSLLLGGLLLAPLPSFMVLGFTGLTALVTYKFVRKRIYNRTKTITSAAIGVSKRLMAGLHGIRDIQAYRQEKPIYKGLEKELNVLVPNNAMITTLGALPSWTLECMGMFTLFVTLAGMICANASIAQITGTLSLLAAMAWRLLPCTNKSVTAITTIQGNKPYLDYFFSALDYNELRSFDEDPEQPPLSFSNTIALDAVSFRYPQAETDTLTCISLAIPKGRTVGIIGPSGAGKSTLIGILTGLLAPSCGSIYIDGYALPNDEYSRLRSLVGFVPQSPYLMDATLAENIALSGIDHPIDEVKLRKVCKMAALDFWEQLPDGFASPLGERGVRLSGGQVQRVAIARALYAEPQLLIFDEATSALDGATENLIQETIFSLREHMTIIMIAHRLSTVEQCDHIYWLDSGSVVAEGPSNEILAEYRRHESLLNQKGDAYLE